MNPTKHSKWNVGRHLAAAFACAALLLLLNSACSAQTITADPNTVTDPAKPSPITLTIKKAEGGPDAATAGQVHKIKVGDAPLQEVNPDAPQGRITFTPPPDLSGPQQVQLLDDTGKPVNDAVGKPLVQTLTYTTPTNPALFESISRVVRQNELSKKDWYQWSILAAFIALLAAFVGTIVRGILRSRSTFRNPLGLPVGSLRAILAYTLVAFLGFYVLTSLLTVSVFAPPDFLLGIVATVVGFYFGSRSDEDGTADERTGIVRGVVRRGTPGGALVSGAMVKFKRDNDGTEPYSRLTDVDGRFVLPGAKPGKYKVSATVAGSGASDSLDINITEGSDQEIEIVIKGAATTGAGGATGGQGGGTGSTGTGGGT